MRARAWSFFRLLAMNPMVSWALFFFWAAAIYFLSSLSPSDDVPKLPAIPHFDKVAHFSAFFAGGVILGFALRNWPRLAWGKIIGIVILTLGLYGFLDELHQLNTPGRSGGDVGDMIADILGAACGALLTPKLYERGFHRTTHS